MPLWLNNWMHPWICILLFYVTLIFFTLILYRLYKDHCSTLSKLQPNDLSSCFMTLSCKHDEGKKTIVVSLLLQLLCIVRSLGSWNPSKNVCWMNENNEEISIWMKNMDNLLEGFSFSLSSNKLSQLMDVLTNLNVIIILQFIPSHYTP